MTKMKMTTNSKMKSKRSLSEGIFPSLFLVFDAKEGEDVLSLMIYEFKCLSIPMLIIYPCVCLLQLIIFGIIHG
jgi:hypothetical protein